MSAIGAAGLLLRQSRDERGIIALTFVVVAITTLLLAAAPRLFNRVAEDALQYALLSVPDVQRGITAAQTSSIRPGTSQGMSEVRKQGAQMAADFPASVDSLISDLLLRVTTTRFRVVDPPSYDTRLSLRYQDGLTDAVNLVAGRWPIDRGEPLEPGAFIGEDDGPPLEPVIIEAALAVSTASDVGVEVGDRLGIVIDTEDPTLFRRGHNLVPAAVEIVGLFAPPDSAAAALEGDTDLLQVIDGGSESHPILFATAYFAPEAYRSLWASGLPFRYEWRYRVDPARLGASGVARLQVDLRRLAQTSAAALQWGDPVTITSSLPAIVDRYAAERALTESVLSVAAIGPCGLAAGAIAMLAILANRRRASSLALARGRGASRRLALGTGLWGSGLVAGSASIVGLLLAILLVPGYDTPVSTLLALAVVLAAVVLAGLATWGVARRPPGGLERDDPPVLRVAPRRLVFELTIVVIATASTLLLQRRGLLLDEATGVTRFDPLLATVPILGGLAAGILAIRVYPLPIRLLGWIAARRHDIVPVLGLRSIGRHPAAASLPLLVLMLTAGFGSFSSVVAATIEHGQGVASYLATGADYRLERVGLGALAPSLDPRSAPGVTAAADGFVDSGARFSSTPRQRVPMFVEAIDLTAYEAVASGTPAAPGWPGSFRFPPEPGVGTADRPIPAILSERLAIGSAELGPGATFQMTVDGEDLTFIVAERRATFPGVATDRPFAIVPLDWLRAATGFILPPNVMWVRASGEAASELAATVAAAPGLTRIVSRYAALAVHTEAPLSAAVADGYWLALVAGAGYMMLTVVGAVVLSTERQTRDLAYLRPLGFTSRQGFGLAVVEHLPPVLLGLLPGIALGIGVAVLCVPGLGLATFVGAVTDVTLFVDWTALASLAGTLLLVAAGAVLLGTWLAGRVRLTDALRAGEN